MSRDRTGEVWEANFNGTLEVGRVRKSQFVGTFYDYWVEHCSLPETTHKYDKWVHFIDVTRSDSSIIRRKWSETTPWEQDSGMKRIT